jgi:hypothetical protein
MDNYKRALVVVPVFCLALSSRAHAQTCYVDDEQTCSQITGATSQGCSTHQCQSFRDFKFCNTALGVRPKDTKLWRTKKQTTQPYHPNARTSQATVYGSSSRYCYESEPCNFGALCTGSTTHCASIGGWTDYGSFYHMKYAVGLNCPVQ